MFLHAKYTELLRNVYGLDEYEIWKCYAENFGIVNFIKQGN